jgi:hypothetical protein
MKVTRLAELEEAVDADEDGDGDGMENSNSHVRWWNDNLK